MSLGNVNRVQEEEPKPSALENAAKILGILKSLGGLAATAASASEGSGAAGDSGIDFSTPVQAAPTLAPQFQEPGFLGGASGQTAPSYGFDSPFNSRFPIVRK